MSDSPPRNKTNFPRLLLIILLTYGLCLGYMAYNQRDFMYFPGGGSSYTKQFDSGLHGAQRLDIAPEEGLSIRGWYWPSKDQNKPIIVYFHGNAQDELHWLDKMNLYTKAGYGFVLAEYRGFSGNAGAPDEQGLYRDARAYIDLLNKMGISPERLVLLGQSLGGGVAVQMALEYPDIHALILESTYTSTVDVARKTYWFLPVSLVMLDRYESINKIGQVSMPVMILHGDQDTLIPYAHAKRLYNAVQQDKKLVKIEGATHFDMQSRGAVKYVVGFLEGLDYSNQQ